MATLYIALLALVAIAILTIAISAVVDVSRRPNWAAGEQRFLAVVETTDRRTEPLPFVGQDRRKSACFIAALKRAA